VLSCSHHVTGPQPVDAVVTHVTLSAPAAQVASGSTLQFTAAASNAEGRPVTGNSVTWASSAPAVAAVSSTGLVTGAQAGTSTITATIAGLTSPGVAVTVIAGPAATLALRTQPSGAAAGAAFTTQPVIEVHDAAGNVAASTAVVTAAIATGGGSLIGTATAPAAAGVATFTNLGIAGTPGSRTLTFTASGLTAVTSAAFPVTAGAPAAYTVTSSSVTPVAGSAVTISAQLVDGGGNAIATAGRTITWSATGSGGSFASPTSLTDATGSTTVQFTSGVTVNSYVITATDNTALHGSSPAVTSVAGPASAAHSLLVTTPTALPADSHSTAAVTLHVDDANGNAVHASAGTAVISSTAGAMSVTTDNHDGTYGAVLTAPGTVGTAIVSATLAGVAVTSADTVAIVTNAATHFVVTSTSTSPVAGSAVTVTAQFADASGTAVSLAGQTVTWSAAGETGGTFTPPSSTTSASGAATTSYTTGTSVGTTYTIGAQDGAGLTGSVSVTNSAGTPASLQWTRASHIVITDTAYSAAAFTGPNQFGRTIAPAVTYVSEATAAATVSASGLVTPAARGQTMLVATATANAAAKDSVLVAVWTAGSPVVRTDLTRFDLKNDTTFTVTAIADMPAGTLLGSTTVTLTWDPTQLTYVSDADGASSVGATVNSTNAANGTLVISAANSTGFGGSVQLRAITFTATATIGKTAPLRLLVSDLTAAGTFTSLLGTTLAITYPLVLR
jgi:adhesin/invasin